MSILKDVLQEEYQRLQALKDKYNEAIYTIIHDGSSGKPDLYLTNEKELVIISCKCLDIKARKNIKWEHELFAEYHFAIKNHRCYKDMIKK